MGDARAWAVLVLATLLPAALSAATLRAERITAENVEELLIGGPDAIGGIGDWYLGNDVVEVIVDDPGREHAKLNHGGTIVDAGLRDRRGEDQFARIFPIVNLSQNVFIDYDSIRAEVDEARGVARLVVTNSRGMSSAPRGVGLLRWLDPLIPEPSEIAHVFVETVYTVTPGDPTVGIATTFHNRGDEPAPIFAYADVWMRGGRSLRSWVGNTLVPERSRGFHHLGFDRANPFAIGDALAASTFVSAPGMRDRPPIAYAIFSPERAAEGLVQFGVTGKHVTLVGAFVVDPGWQETNLLRLARATQSELAPGARWTFERRLLVVGGADVASTTDLIFPRLRFADGDSGISGSVAAAGVPHAIHVSDARSGAPITQAMSAVDGPDAGRFRAVVPPGDYRLTVRAPQHGSAEIDVTVSPGRFADVRVPELTGPGWLVFDPAFRDGGSGRVIVVGVGDTADPVFDPELLDFRIDGRRAPSGTETNELYFRGDARDLRRVAIPPGRYELFAVRGFESDVARFPVVIDGPGREVVVPAFAVERLIVIDGTVVADFHVHAEASDDSGTRNASRLTSFIASGVDVFVSTDHDHVGNYDAALDALDARGRIRVIHGVEVTSSAPSRVAPHTIAHHNAWPIRHRRWAHRRGAPESQNRSVAELYAELRRDHGVGIVQLNHPRAGSPGETDDEALFTHLGTGGAYDPTRPLDSPGNDRLLATARDGRTRAIDFDAIELMNGRPRGRYLQVREDWHSLLRQGVRRTATANSDTHGPSQLPGYPRNYVRAANAASGDSSAALDAAVREGRLFGTNGPLITAFRANGGEMGDVVAAPGGRVEIEIAVAAAPYVPVDEVRLLANGEVVRRFGELPAGEGAPVARLGETVILDLERDAFLTVEAGAPLDVEPAVWLARNAGLYTRVVAPGFVAEAFSNPIFVDVDGNGVFDAPGLPEAPRDLPALVDVLMIPGGVVLFALAIRRWRRRGQSAAREA